MIGARPVLDGRYELGEELGHGGMAVVRRARDLRLGREVAVKVLHADVAEDPDAVRAFRAEAMSSARLSHPGIVSVFDVGEATIDDVRRPFLVMEMIEGPPLSAQLVDGTPLTIERSLEIAIDVTAALAHAHERGVVHRDVTPGNLIVQRDGQVRVTDFGIARALPTSVSGPHPGALGPDAPDAGARYGSVSYLSPEQARRGPVDARSDLYSVGCLLMTMLTGYPPFRGSDTEIVRHHLRTKPPAPSSRRPGLEALDDIVLRCLEKDPWHRPQSAAELRRDLLLLLGEIDAAAAWAAGANGLATAAPPLDSRRSSEVVDLPTARVGSALLPDDELPGPAADSAGAGAAAAGEDSGAAAGGASQGAPAGDPPAGGESAGVGPEPVTGGPTRGGAAAASSGVVGVPSGGAATVGTTGGPVAAGSTAGDGRAGGSGPGPASGAAVSGSDAAGSDTRARRDPTLGGDSDSDSDSGDGYSGDRGVGGAAGAVAGEPGLVGTAAAGPVASESAHQGRDEADWVTIDATGRARRAGPGRTQRSMWFVALALVVLVPSILATVLWPRDTRPIAAVGAQEQSTVPPVEGLTVEAARELLLDAGFAIDETRTVSSVEVSVGFVAGTDPAGGTRHDRGGEVDLLISSGPADVAVPNVDLLPLDEARVAIEDAGLVVGEVLEVPSAEPRGTVLNADPGFGRVRVEGTAVDLVVASGENQIPAVQGLSSGDAVAALGDAGFSVDVERRESSKPEGRVIETKPAAGALVRVGTTISVAVSGTPVPEVTRTATATATTTVTVSPPS